MHTTNSPAPPPVTIRKASLDDAAGIAELGTRVFTVTFGHSVPPEELNDFLEGTYSTRAVTEYLRDGTKDTVVATDDSGRILGFAALARGTTEPCLEGVENKVELQRIYVDTAAHGRKIGSSLARVLEDVARREGYKHMWLGVWEENYAAQKVYENWGYKRVGEHDFVIGSVVQTDNIMTKVL